MEGIWTALLGLAIAAGSVGLLRVTRNPVRSLPHRWQVALAIPIWVVETLLLVIAFVFIAGIRLAATAVADPTPLERIGSQLVLVLPLVAALATLAWSWGVPSFPDVGLLGRGPGRRYIARDVGFGLLLGPLAVGIFLVAGLIGGWNRVTGVAPPGMLLANLALGALLFLCVAVFEELSGRGCLFALVARIAGIPAAVVISAAIFALLHGANPGAGGAALAGIALAGLVFVFAFLRTGMLWLPMAFHLSWDWAETSLYGFPDSGTPPASALQLAIDPHAPEWATGGVFGPEASAFVALALAFVVAAVWFYTRDRAGRALLFPAGAPERRTVPDAAPGEGAIPDAPAAGDPAG